MAYLRLKDYDRFIQADNLLQVLSQDDTLRLLAESAAQEEVTSYLIQKYDTAQEFQNMLAYSPSITYYAGTRVELNYATYVPTQTYSAGAGVTYNGGEYISVAGNSPEVWNAAHWTQIGNQYDIWNIPLPYPEFSVYNNYSVGDRIFWKGNIYQCLIATYGMDHETFLNVERYEDIALPNVFPDDPLNGTVYWGGPVAYSFSNYNPGGAGEIYLGWDDTLTYSPGERITDSNGLVWQALVTNNNVVPGSNITAWMPIDWLKSDNRSQQMVMVMVDVVLYHLHSRIAPKNIPQLRMNRYAAAIAWLDGAADGMITPNLAQYQPRQGARISFGGNTKLNNTY